VLADVTPVILTYNELPNIERTLARLSWARRIVVVDSYSDDGTVELLRAHPAVEVVQHGFESFASQWNFALQHVQTDWALTLDADYVCSEELAAQMESRLRAGTAAGVEVPFVYCVFGKPLRGTLYPPRVVLFRRHQVRFTQEGHHQRTEVDGRVERLSAPIFHDDRKPLTAWLAAQQRYTREEAVKLGAAARHELALVDRLRRHPFLVPALTPAYCLIVKGLLFDGLAGWYYAGQRTYAELLLSLRLLELRLAARAL